MGITYRQRLRLDDLRKEGVRRQSERLERQALVDAALEGERLQRHEMWQMLSVLLGGTDALVANARPVAWLMLVSRVFLTLRALVEV